MSGEAWTVADHALLRRMAEEGHSLQTIATALGRSRSAVCGMAHRRGVRLPGPANAERKAAKAARLAAKPAKRGGWTQTRTERLAALVAEGLTAAEIGERMGASRQGIIDVCKRYGIEMRRGRRKTRPEPEGEGPKVDRRRVPAERVALLRKLAADGLTMAQIAERAGVSRKSVGEACKAYEIPVSSGRKLVWTDARTALMHRLAEAGVPSEEAARRLEVGAGALASAARKAGLSFKPSPEEGDRHGGYRPQRVWTDDRLAVMREVAAAGGTAAQAAERLGVTASVLKSAARKYGIRFDSHRARQATIWDGKDERLRALVAAGHPRSVIARELGVSEKSVRTRCLAMRLCPARGAPRKAGVGPSPAAQVSLAGVRPVGTPPVRDAGEARRVGNVIPLPKARPDGGAGRLHILDAVNGRCRMPLWSDNGHVPLEDKYVCGAPTKSLKESYCPACRATAWTKPRAPVRRAVKAAIERRVGSW